MNQQTKVALKRFPHIYIGGEWVEPVDGGTMESIDPATGLPWAEVAYGGPADIDRAVAAAREAFEGPWSQVTGTKRARLLLRLGDIYQARSAELAALESRDSGRTIREALGDVGTHSNWYHWFASLADKTYGETIPMETHMHVFTTKVPIGVVGAILPWNAPMLTTTWKLGAALAAGCTIVLKPAELTPVTALELAKMCEEAGFPPGVVNVVPGYGASGAGARLVDHPGVDKVSFTGEGTTARAMLKAGADSLKRFTFELGGKSPHIIMADANVDQAVNAATGSAWVLCGQSCALGSRVLVERPVYDQVVEAFAARAAKVRVGMPQDKASHMGPQASDEQLQKTLRYIGIGRDEGAELVAGGERINEGAMANGYFVKPTVFAGVNNDMRIAQEEIFGPVASIIPFDGEEEAVSIANATTYGLTAGLWTNDLGKAHRVSSKIRAGTVWVNTYRYVRWTTPYGGFKSSGWGRENGLHALEPFLETRTTAISTTAQFPDAYAD